jgi:restriction system protein
MVARYQQISVEETRFFAAPAEDRILEKLVWPLRHAKSSYTLGNFLGTISLCGMVAEMVAMLLFDITEPTLNNRPMENRDREALFGRSFEKLDPYRRVEVLRAYGAIDDQTKEAFELIRATRRRYLHLWSQDHDRLADDAVSVFKAAVRLVVRAVGQDIQKGDLVALPLKTESAFAFGRVTGDYQYKKVAPNVMHSRSVEWLKTVPRSVLPKDILLWMSGMLAVFKVTRNDAEGRVKKILSLPTSVSEDATETAEAEIEGAAGEETVNLEEAARDEILKFIETKFTGHDLARLVDAVLRAQGYKTEVSPPGPDGGVDILAGSGPLGFDKPRLCVQVKSGSGAEGQKTLNELLGVVTKFDSEQGLLVSWGGFTSPVKQDARKAFFTIRLWDQGDVVDSILQNYERLDDEIKAELPLKRIWVMVNDEAK